MSHPFSPTRNRKTYFAPIEFTSSPPSGGTSTFTVSTWPSDPYVGEVVHVEITGSGGHTISNPLMSSGENLADIWVQTDVGEAGASFTVGATDKDATIAPGRYFGHAYASAGSKTLTISSWTFGSPTDTQTASVTVTDPDTETWDHTYWVDLNGTTTDMPANDASNTRILSYANWTAQENTTLTTDRVRVLFRGGVTHTLTGNNQWTQSAEVVYLDSFGTGRAKILDGTGTFADSEFIAPRSNVPANNRIIIKNIDFESTYNPITGDYGDSDFVAYSTAGVVGAGVSFWRVTAKGMGKLFKGGGSRLDDKQYKIGCVDVKAEEWRDYGLGFTGSCDSVVVRGCEAIQHPAAGIGDAKTGTNPEYPDHASLRIPRFRVGGISQCNFGSQNGWSALTPTYGIQPAIRLYMNENPVGTEFCIIGNYCSGRYLVQWGRASDSENILNPAKVLIAANNFDFGRQGAFGIQCHVGGFYLYSNVFYVPNISSARTSQVYEICDLRIDSGSGTIATVAYTEPAYVGHNTYFSDATSSLNHGASAIAVTSEDTSGALIPDVTKAGNQRSGDGNTGTYIAASAFARGDDFRPITSGAAVSTVTTGPPVDLNFNKRSNPTNEGAHHTHGSDVSVTAPTNSATPTIAANAVTNDYGVHNIGTWSDNQNWMLEFNWEVNGSPAPDSSMTHSATFTDATTGNLTCDLIRTNRSGTRSARATSNTIAI